MMYETKAKYIKFLTFFYFGQQGKCMSQSCILCMANYNLSEPPVPLSHLKQEKGVRMLCYGDSMIKNNG